MTLSSVPSALPVRDFFDRLPREWQAGHSFRRLADGCVGASWFGCELASVFQPIVSPASLQTVGHEAFLRCFAGGYRDLSPWLLFSANADDDRLIALDRLARTLHAVNFVAPGNDGLLFLNVHGRLLAAVADDHGAAFRRVADALEMPPERIVIETPVVASRQADLLSFVLRNYRRNGFRVAVNVESVEQWAVLSGVVGADFVKIDAAALNAEDDPIGAMGRLDALAGGARIIVKRVGTVPNHDWLRGALVQGFAYGGPRAQPVRERDLSLG